MALRTISLLIFSMILSTYQPGYAAPVTISQANDLIKTVKEAIGGIPKWLKDTYQNYIPIETDIKDRIELAKLTALHKRIVAHSVKKSLVARDLKNIKLHEQVKWDTVRTEAASIVLTGQAIVSDLASVDAAFATEPAYKNFNEAFESIAHATYNALDFIGAPDSIAEVNEIHKLGNSLEQLVIQINQADDALVSCIRTLEGRIKARV